CFRDEDLRADRQPEFTQLDIEMSFVDEEDVFEVLELAISTAWSEAGFEGRIGTPFPRLTWAEAMARYGSDKPDVRFGLELQDLTDAVRGTQFQVFARVAASGGIVKGIRVPGGVDLTRGDIEGELTDLARSSGARGLAYVWRREEGFDGLVARHLSADELAEIGRITSAEPGDLVLMVADRPPVVAAALGALRLLLGRRRGLVDEERLAMLWVTEFPMFELDGVTGRPTPLHHPFTMVVPEDVGLLDSGDPSDLIRIRSRAYDIVLNGREIGSGSIRIHRPDVQRKVFAAIGLSGEEARRKFGFLLDAFEHGVPPHGGFAAGIDRLVMEGLREENIRDVIAFPKTQQAQELMTDSPAAVEPEQLVDLGIALRPAPPS
ncbi:MAG TPA: aspartate--tRNA ligase, partial [Candidatus Dormibacteraeota bacterium]|nr:aspartate--tRNA ligase [Candidatus Dormibacteraeota bacterium]